MPTSFPIPATILQGHRVASGLNGNPLFPGGTLRMQLPVFCELGLDLSPFYPGTLNVSIVPCRYHIVSPWRTFRGVKWHPTEPAEDFSFFDVLLRPHEPDACPVPGLIYHPHPDTKPAHFQQPEVLELLLPWMADLAYGQTVWLESPPEQIVFENA